jgi:hypothetical protein
MWLKPLFARTSKNAKSGLRKWLEVLPHMSEEDEEEGLYEKWPTVNNVIFSRIHFLCRCLVHLQLHREGRAAR